MKKIAIRYALVIFVITVIWTMLEHVMGYNTTDHETGQITRLLTAFAYYGTVVLAIWKVRQQQDDILSFKQGIMTGLYCSLTYSLLVTFWFALYAEVINKQYQPTLLAFTRAKLEADGKSAAEIATMMQRQELSSGGSVVSYLLLFTMMLLFGMIVSLIASLLMQRRTARVRTA